MADHTTFITDTNKTPAIQIVVWVLLGGAVLCVLLRMYTKLAIVRFIGADDFMVPASLIFLAGQSAAVTIQTLNGLGKPLREMSPAQLETNYLYQWIALLLYIPSLCFSKLATLFLLHLISSLRAFQQLFAATGILIVCWALSAEFVVAFWCNLPQPWRVPEDKCIDRVVFLTYFEAMNAATDILLMFLPLSIAWNVKTSRKRKAWVLIVFFARGLGAAVALTKILLERPRFADAQPRMDNWLFVLFTQLIQFLSLMSACMLYLRPFIEALTSGFINGDDLRRRGQMTPMVISTAPNVAMGALGAIPVQPSTPEDEKHRGRKRVSRTPPQMQSGRAANWPLPAGPIGYDDDDDDDDVGVSREVAVPSEEEEETAMAGATSSGGCGGRSGGVPAPTAASGSETRRFQLEQTKAGSVYAPSVASRYVVGPLRMPAFPRDQIPLGQNNLPRVSQIYSPLAEENAILSYIAAGSNSVSPSGSTTHHHDRGRESVSPLDDDAWFEAPRHSPEGRRPS